MQKKSTVSRKSSFGNSSQDSFTIDSMMKSRILLVPLRQIWNVIFGKLSRSAVTSVPILISSELHSQTRLFDKQIKFSTAVSILECILTWIGVFWLPKPWHRSARLETHSEPKRNRTPAQQRLLATCIPPMPLSRHIAASIDHQLLHLIAVVHSPSSVDE